MAKGLTVKQELWSSEGGDAEEIPTEVMATSIVAISEGMKKIMSGRLTESALVILIQAATPGRLPAKDIVAVIRGIQSLEKTFLKPRATK